jgi:hypothetical protein
MCLKNIPNGFKLKKTFTVNSKFNWFKAIATRLQTIRKGPKKNASCIRKRFVSISI